MEPAFLLHILTLQSTHYSIQNTVYTLQSTHYSIHNFTIPTFTYLICLKKKTLLFYVICIVKGLSTTMYTLLSQSQSQLWSTFKYCALTDFGIRHANTSTFSNVIFLTFPKQRKATPLHPLCPVALSSPCPFPPYTILSSRALPNGV